MYGHKLAVEQIWVLVQARPLHMPCVGKWDSRPKIPFSFATELTDISVTKITDDQCIFWSQDHRQYAAQQHHIHSPSLTLDKFYPHKPHVIND